MKKFCLSGLILAFLLIGNSSFALPQPMEKLKRGVTNIVTAPLEIGKQISKEWNSTNVRVFGFFGGLIKGVAYTLQRLGSGVVDVISFPAKLKEDYDPIMKPAYILDKE